jgi:integration host factor subunit beta
MRAGRAESPEQQMTKAELVKEVATAADLTKKHSEVIVNVVFQSIINALQQDEKVELRGFGSFRIRQRRSRQGRNPKTGDKVQVPPKKIPYFKPGKELKQFINDALIPGVDVPLVAPPRAGRDAQG